MTKLRRLIRSEKAATAIEYGLIAALIALAGITAFNNFGTGAMSMWNNVKDKTDEAIGTP